MMRHLEANANELDEMDGMDVAATSSSRGRAASAGTGATSGVAPVAARVDFRVLYQENVAFVWRNLRRLGVFPCDLEDRTQEVFLVAFRRIADFEDRGFGPRAWLYQISFRVAADGRRHRKRHPEDVTADLGEGRASERPDADPVALLERRRALETLDRALETIDVDRRAVLVLHEIEEMSAPEIAAVLEIPVNTVYSRLRVARAELELALRGARARQVDSESGPSGKGAP